MRFAELVQRPKKHIFHLQFYDDRYCWYFQPPEELPGIVIISFNYNMNCPPTGGKTNSSPRTTCVEYTKNGFFVFFSNNGTSRKKGSNWWCSWWGLNSRFQVQNLPPRSTFFNKIHTRVSILQQMSDWQQISSAEQILQYYVSKSALNSEVK